MEYYIVISDAVKNQAKKKPQDYVIGRSLQFLKDGWETFTKNITFKLWFKGHKSTISTNFLAKCVLLRGKHGCKCPEMGDVPRFDELRVKSCGWSRVSKDECRSRYESERQWECSQERPWTLYKDFGFHSECNRKPLELYLNRTM